MTHINQIAPDALALAFSLIPRENDDKGKTLACLMRVCKTWRNTILAERYDSMFFQPIAKQLALPFHQGQPDINNCKLWRSLCQYGGPYYVINGPIRLAKKDFIAERNLASKLFQVQNLKNPEDLSKLNDLKTEFFLESLRFHNDIEFPLYNNETNKLEIRNRESFEPRFTMNFTPKELTITPITGFTNRFLIRTDVKEVRPDGSNKFILYDLKDNLKELEIPVNALVVYGMTCDDHYLVAIAYQFCKETQKGGVIVVAWDLTKPEFPKLFEKEILSNGTGLNFKSLRIEQNHFLALITDKNSYFNYLICNLKTGNHQFLRLSENIEYIRPEPPNRPNILTKYLKPSEEKPEQMPNIIINYWWLNGATPEHRERVISFPPKEGKVFIPLTPALRIQAIKRLFTQAIQSIRLVVQRLGDFAWTHRRLLILTGLVLGSLAIGNTIAKSKR